MRVDSEFDIEKRIDKASDIVGMRNDRKFILKMMEKTMSNIRDTFCFQDQEYSVNPESYWRLSCFFFLPKRSSFRSYFHRQTWLPR